MNKNLLNEQIIAKYKEIFLIDAEGKALGNISAIKALDMAYNLDLDLICVKEEDQKLPICKMLNYSKHQYNAKKAIKQKVTSSCATVQLSCRISEHDYNIKILKAKDLLQENKAVLLVLKCSYKELRLINTLALQTIKKATIDLAEYSTRDSEPKIEGKILKVTLNPRKLSK